MVVTRLDSGDCGCVVDDVREVECRTGRKVLAVATSINLPDGFLSGE